LSGAAAVLRNDSVGRVEHDLGGAVVLFQPDQPGAGKVLEERLHVANVGSAPAVDGLIVVAHRADIAVGAEQSDELVLGAVGVLELVDHHVCEAALPLVAHVGVALPQPHGLDDEIVEVERPVVGERILIPLIDDGHALLPVPISVH